MQKCAKISLTRHFTKFIFLEQLVAMYCTLYTNIQQDQKAKLDYHMSMLFAYMAGGKGGWGLEVLKSFDRRGQNCFFLLCVCVGGGGSGSVPLLP